MQLSVQARPRRAHLAAFVRHQLEPEHQPGPSRTAHNIVFVLQLPQPLQQLVTDVGAVGLQPLLLNHLRGGALGVKAVSALHNSSNVVRDIQQVDVCGLRARGRNWKK